MATIFLSHSSRDDRLASDLQGWLLANGFDDLFVDHSDIRLGDRWRDALRSAKGSCRVVLCLVTPDWLASDECIGEFTAAFYSGKRIIPLFARLSAALDDVQRRRLDRARAEDQGFDLSEAIRDGQLDLASRPEIERRLAGGLRAGGALAKVGLDPEAFEIDRESRPSPFPGLESFGDDDADAAIFYGRSPEIARCLEDLREMRAGGVRQPYVILGASGSGKSSLLKAGVLPRLRRERGWVVLRSFRPGADPLFNFANAIARTFADHAESLSPGAIRDDLLAAWRTARKGSRFVPPDGSAAIAEHVGSYFARLREKAGRPHSTVLIALDQAEELARSPGEPADAVSDYLRATAIGLSSAAAASGEASALLVLTIRSDSFAEFQKSERFIGFDARCCDIRPVPLYRFDAAIEEPAARYGIQIEPGLVEAMIDDAPGEDALPLLAFALQRLWKQYSAEKRLQRTGYDSIGKLSGMIDDASERALAGLDPERDEPLAKPVGREIETLAAHIFIPRLAQISDSGAPIRRVAAVQRFDAAARTLIDNFIRWRLLVAKPAPEPGSATVEVAHEAIFRSWARLQNWIEQERSRMQILRDLESAARDWDHRRRAKAYLDHRGHRLKETLALVGSPDFGQQAGERERHYLKACRRARGKRRAAAVAAAVLLAITAFVVAGIFEFNDMRSAMRAAAEQQIAGGLPLDAAKYAIAGTLDRTALGTLIKVPDAETALRQTGFTVKLLVGVDETYAADAFELTGDGTRLVIQSVDDAGAVWDVDRGTRLTELGGNGSVTSFNVSDDGTRLVTRSTDNGLSFWNLTTGERLGGSGSASYAKAFISSRTMRLVTLSESGTATLWDLKTAQSLGIVGTANEVDGFKMTSDPPRLLIHSRQRACILIDALTGTEIADLGGPDSCDQYGFVGKGTRLLSVTTSGIGTLRDTKDASPITTINPGSRISGFASSADGWRLITRTIYNILTLWDAKTGAWIADIGSSDADNYNFSDDGRQIIERSTNSTGRLLDAATGKVLTQFGAGELSQYAFASKGDRLVTLTLDKAASLWDSATGTKIVTLSPPGGAEVGEFSPDGSRLSVGATAVKGSLWDATTGRKISDYGDVAEADSIITFAKSSPRFVTSNSSNAGSLWDSTDASFLADLGGEGAVADAAISADGSRIATQSVFETMAVWDASRLPGKRKGPDLRAYVCELNYDAIGVFPADVRSAAVQPPDVSVAVGGHLAGRPWHPCDWRGLLSLEGWGQMLRFWAVRLGLPWDYDCGERTAFGGIDPEAASLCSSEDSEDSTSDPASDTPSAVVHLRPASVSPRGRYSQPTQPR